MKLSPTNYTWDFNFGSIDYFDPEMSARYKRRGLKSGFVNKPECQWTIFNFSVVYAECML